MQIFKQNKPIKKCIEWNLINEETNSIIIKFIFRIGNSKDWNELLFQLSKVRWHEEYAKNKNKKFTIRGYGPTSL